MPPAWTDLEIDESPAQVRVMLRTQTGFARTMAQQAKTCDGGGAMVRLFSLDFVRRGGCVGLNNNRLRIQKIAAAAPRALRTVRDEWRSFIRYPEPKARKTYEELAKGSPAAFYFYMVNVRANAPWNSSHHTGHEASNSSSWRKLPRELRRVWLSSGEFKNALFL